MYHLKAIVKRHLFRSAQFHMHNRVLIRPDFPRLRLHMRWALRILLFVRLGQLRKKKIQKKRKEKKNKGRKQISLLYGIRSVDKFYTKIVICKI